MSRFPFPMRRRSADGSGRSSGFKMRLIMAAVIALIAVVSYYGMPGDVNQITGESERVALTEEADEMALGLQALPQVMDQHGGPTNDANAQRHVKQIGNELVRALAEAIASDGRQIPYKFDFHLLADPQLVNAFALPGGQIFITEALYSQLETEGQLAGVLGHEVGHVIERHGNKRMAKDKLFSGLAMAGGVAGGDVESARMSQAVAQMVSMSHGREDELASDKWGVKLTAMAGYDPRAMIGVMEVLDRAGGGGGQPEFFSTHPKPANRVEYIEGVIAEEFPEGVPEGLKP
ncbi:MAG: M48 family metallopeptidase [Pirellulales bacterium]